MNGTGCEITSAYRFTDLCGMFAITDKCADVSVSVENVIRHLTLWSDTESVNDHVSTGEFFLIILLNPGAFIRHFRYLRIRQDTHMILLQCVNQRISCTGNHLLGDSILHFNKRDILSFHGKFQRAIASACAIVLHQNEEGWKHLQTRDHFAIQLFRGYASQYTVKQAFSRGLLKESDHYQIIASELPPDMSWEMILQNQWGCLLRTEEGITYILKPSSSDISSFTDWIVSRGYRIGKSFLFSDLLKCKQMAGQAELAIAYGRHHTDEKVIDFRKDSVSILMHQGNSDLFVHPVIQEIRQYDEINHTDYIETLTVWLNSAMDDAASAQKLDIHRNTLYYRMHRISELFHINLKDMNTCVQLYLSMK